MNQTAHILIIALPFFWLGLVGGISFLETPLKFRAPGVTLALGLGIGRLVFTTLNRVEITLCLSLLVAAMWQSSSLALPLALAGLLCLQTFWLLPKLDARAGAIIAAQSDVPASRHHLMYIALEILKLILLAGYGLQAITQLINR